MRTLLVEVITPLGFLLWFGLLGHLAPWVWVLACLGFSWVWLGFWMALELRRPGVWFWVTGSLLFLTTLWALAGFQVANGMV